MEYAHTLKLLLMLFYSNESQVREPLWLYFVYKNTVTLGVSTVLGKSCLVMYCSFATIDTFSVGNVYFKING